MEKEIGGKVKKLNVAETITELTRKHLLENNGVIMGQCLLGAGNVAGTVPNLTEDQGVLELSMDDTSGSGIAVGYALAGRRPIFVSRYAGFMQYNAINILNYASKSLDLWGVPCPIFARVSGSDGSSGPPIGPVASACHHGLAMRMPRIKIAAPMTPREYLEVWENFMSDDYPTYCSEHRRSYLTTDDMLDVVLNRADITIFAISSTRLNALEALPVLSKEGIRCNLINLLWLKPFKKSPLWRELLETSRFGGIVLDSDYTNTTAKCIAYDLMHYSGKPVRALGIEDKVAGFARHLDVIPPSPEKICDFIRKIINNRL